MNMPRQIITTEEIEDLKQQILDLFYFERQNQINFKQNIKNDLNELVQKVEVILDEIEK
jgi:hypothetical protein